MKTLRLFILGGIIATVPALSTPVMSQTATDKAGTTSDLASLADCARPDDAKEAKVIEIDTGKSLAKLALNLGSGRFKLVRITVWDRPEDTRPLVPVIEAARIMQGVVQFYTPTLNTDPESAHDSYLLLADMGGGPICWATPSSLLKESRGPDARLKPAGVGEPAPRSEIQPRTDSVSSNATSTTPGTTQPAPDNTPTAAAPVTRRRSGTPPRSNPRQ